MKLPRLNALPLAVLLIIYGSSFAKSTIQQTKVVEVPFVYEHGRIYVPVRLNGLETIYSMAVVTGVKRSVLNPAVAKSAGVTITISNPNAADYDINYSRQAVVRRLEIGKLEFGNLDVGIIETGGADGILGTDFLKDYAVQIDFPKRVIRFYESSPFPKGAATVVGAKAVVPLKIEGPDRLSIIEEVVANGKELKVSLDTGFAGSLALTPAAGTHVGLTSTTSKTNPEKAKIDTFAIGALRVNSLTAWLYGKGSGFEMSLDTMGGVVGNGFMEKYVVTLDYKNKVAVFQ